MMILAPRLSGIEGLEKRQCTAQLTVFANGETLKLFRGGLVRKNNLMVGLLCASRRIHGVMSQS